MEDMIKRLELTDEQARKALDDIALARQFPVRGGFVEEQPSGWYPCRTAAPQAVEPCSAHAPLAFGARSAS